jgi:uncharacterized protein involved in cysteine biosynthesis
MSLDFSLKPLVVLGLILRKTTNAWHQANFIQTLMNVLPQWMPNLEALSWKLSFYVFHVK